MIRASAELQFQLSQRNIQSILRQLQSRMNVPLNINTANAHRSLANVGREFNRATGFATNFGLAVGDSARRFAAYGAGVAIIAKVAIAFKTAATEALKFDKDMTTLSQVTGKTREQLSGLTKEILNLSVRTGISAAKLGELTVTLSQAELKGKDLSNALDVIAKSDLAPSFENMEDSVEGLIAIMQQFKRPSSEFLKQFGFINELSKAYAVESKDIIEGVKRTGSVFASAGASLEEFAAIMTVVRSTTRESAESIATGLKTITERIQRPEIIDYLKELGVELVNAEGKFIGPLKAFEALNAALQKRGSLSTGSLELIAVAKEIGGGRQLSKILPLLQSATKAQIALTAASKNAADSLANDEVIAMKSLSKQLDVLKADFNKFIVELSISDEFKDMAKSALGFADALIQVAKATKPFIPIIADLAVAFGATTLLKGFRGTVSPKFSSSRLPEFATGGVFTGSGYVRGPGGPTDDQVNARLSNREFVIKASSTSKIGRNRLEYMNTFGEVPKFAGGGLVGSASAIASSPVVSGAAFLILSQVLKGLREESEGATTNLDKFKSGIIPIIPASVLLYSTFTKLNSVMGSIVATASNFNANVQDGPRRRFERERENNLREAQRNSNAPLTSRQRKLADPVTARVLAAGGTIGEAAIARRAFGKSINGRVVEERTNPDGSTRRVEVQSRDPNVAGNIGLAQRRAIEAVTNARQQNVVSNVNTTNDTVDAARQLRAGTASSIRGMARAGSIGFAGMTPAQVAAITGATTPGSAGRRGRDRVIRRNQGTIDLANFDIRAAEGRLRSNPVSLKRLTNQRNDARVAYVRGLGTMTPAQQRASLANIRNLNTQINDKTTDINLIRSRKSLIRSTNESVSALNLLNRLDDRLASATTAQTNAATARANLGANVAGFTEGVSRGPRTSFLTRQRQGLGRVSEFAGNNSTALAVGTAAVVGFTAALNAGTAVIERKNAAEAIAAGSAQEAYRATQEAARNEANSKNVLAGGGVGAGIGSVVGGVAGAALGGPIGAAAGTALGQTIGGLVGSFAGLTGAVESISDTIFATNTNLDIERQALEAKREASVINISKSVNDGLKKYADQNQLNDKSQSVQTLLKTISSTFDSAKTTDATNTDLKDLYSNLFQPAYAEFSRLADEGLAVRKGFAEIKRENPQLVGALDRLLAVIGDPTLTQRIQEEVAARDLAIEGIKQDDALRVRLLAETKLAIAAQHRLNRSLQTLNNTTRTLAKSSRSSELRNQVVSGSVSGQGVEDFGVDLFDTSNLLTAEFNETINALGRFSNELDNQTKSYARIVQASQELFIRLPEITSPDVAPDIRDQQISKAVTEIFGFLGIARTSDISGKIKDAVADQEGSGKSALEKSLQLEELFKGITADLAEPFKDNISKSQEAIGNNLKQLADTLDKENDLRNSLIDQQIESIRRLEDFSASFTKTTSGSVAAARRGRVDTILSSVGGRTTGNDANDFQKLTGRRNVAADRLNTLNQNTSVTITEAEIREKAKLVNEVNVLGKALAELTNVSEDVTKAQEALAQLEDKQSKLRGKASELAFGGSDSRNSFSRSLVAQKFVSAGGNLQSLPEELRSELFSFLQEFGDAKVFNGQSGTEIINKETSKFLRGLGYSNDQVSTLLTEMQPIEKRQLEALLEIANNTAAASAPAAANVPAAAAANRPIGLARGGQARGTDTVPAMLTPGEFIVSRNNARRNKGVLNDINNGATYAFTGGEIQAGGGTKKTSGIKPPLQLYNENQERLRKAAAAKAIGTMVKDKSLEGASESTRNRLLLGIDKADQFAAEKKQMDQLLAEAPADSSAAARAIGRRAVNAQTGNEEINKAYRSMGQGYDTRRQTDYGTGGMTTKEVEAVARRHATDVVTGRTAQDSTGLGKRFNKDSILLYGMEGGSGPLSPTGGQSGLGNKLGLDRYEQQATGFKPAEMLRIADEKARNPEREYAKQRSRQKELERIEAYREAKANGTLEKSKVPAGPRPVYKPKVKEIKNDRIIKDLNGKLPIIGNEDVMTAEQVQSMLNDLVSTTNLKKTKTFLKQTDRTDADFAQAFLANSNQLSSKYGQIAGVLFGKGTAKAEGIEGNALFSGSRFVNGAFHSGIVNQAYLAKNQDKINAIIPLLDELSTTGSATDPSELALNKVSKNAFGRTMKNLRETLGQISAGQQQAAVQQAQAQAQVQAVPQAMIDDYGPQNRKRSSLSGGSLSANGLSDEQLLEMAKSNTAMFITPNDSITSGANTSIEELRTYRAMTPKEMEDYKKNGFLPKEGPAYPELTRPKKNAYSIGREIVAPTQSQLEDRRKKSEETYSLGVITAEQRRKDLIMKTNAKIIADGNAIMEARRKEQYGIKEEIPNIKGRFNSLPNFYDGGIVGGMGGRDNNTAQVTRGEGIIQAKSMNKIGASAFNQINKTGELPMKEIQLNVDALMKTPPWMKDFQSSVAALAGTSIKAELAPVSVNVKINGAEVLASIQGQMKDLIKREVMTAVGNMYHDNSGKHLVRGM